MYSSYEYDPSRCVDEADDEVVYLHGRLVDRLVHYNKRSVQMLDVAFKDLTAKLMLHYNMLPDLYMRQPPIQPPPPPISLANVPDVARATECSALCNTDNSETQKISIEYEITPQRQAYYNVKRKELGRKNSVFPFCPLQGKKVRYRFFINERVNLEDVSHMRDLRIYKANDTGHLALQRTLFSDDCRKPMAVLEGLVVPEYSLADVKLWYKDDILSENSILAEEPSEFVKNTHVEHDTYPCGRYKQGLNAGFSIRAYKRSQASDPGWKLFCRGHIRMVVPETVDVINHMSGLDRQAIYTEIVSIKRDNLLLFLLHCALYYLTSLHASYELYHRRMDQYDKYFSFCTGRSIRLEPKRNLKNNRKK